MPTKEQANTYAGVKAYLEMVQAAGADAPDAVIAKFKSLPLDYFGKRASVRADGRVIYDLALYEVKSPEQSKAPWDYYRKIGDVKGEDAFLPLLQGGCAFASPAAAK